MKKLVKLTFVIASVISMSVLAHDPAMHEQKSEKADCSTMDHSKMDMKDPVTIAMMKKCQQQTKNINKEHSTMNHSTMNHSEADSKNNEHAVHNH